MLITLKTDVNQHYLPSKYCQYFSIYSLSPVVDIAPAVAGVAM